MNEYSLFSLFVASRLRNLFLHMRSEKFCLKCFKLDLIILFKNT